ncbi:MAG TPA: SMC-Scp complex subunit ScpB [Thermoanaerobaculia bacterium]|nr:SMC-Scp complex subunit ScpB [Thermoanaerobaculia bacterium]
MAMEANELRAALEAILFLSSDPVRVDDLAESLDEAKDAVSAQLEEIKRNLDERLGGFMLEQAAGGWRLTTRAEHDAILKKYFAKKGENRLSLAALETLAIVAYRQPITAPEVSDIRGVNSSSSIRTLLERRMIRVAGRKNVVGSPFLYRTTKDFLVHFGLNDIRDLPRLEEFGDLIGESINEDLVAAINAAPEPTGEGIIEESNDAATAGDASDVEQASDAVADAPADDAIAHDASVSRDEEPAADDRADVAHDDDTSARGDEGTTFEEEVAGATDETQLESPGTEKNED